MKDAYKELETAIKGIRASWAEMRNFEIHTGKCDADGPCAKCSRCLNAVTDRTMRMDASMLQLDKASGSLAREETLFDIP